MSWPMTCETPIKRQVPQKHREAAQKIDCWRGQCVRHYARLEQAIASVVVALAPADPEPGFGLGCRVKQFARLTEGASGVAVKINKRLQQFESARDRRSAIVHGDGCIYVDADGNWLWDARFLQQRETVSTTEVFRQAEAEELERELKHNLQSICALLANLAAERQADPGSCPG